MSDFLEVIPLGGLGEFGMNCAAIRFGEEMILVDAGMTFPGGGSGGDLGVDIIVPDLTFLIENRDQLKAILLTHGHEDHAGAVAYVLKEVQVPVYASPLTLGLVERRLQEHRLDKVAELIPLQARQPVEFESLRVEPLNVTHSFPDSLCFAITSPVGTIIWTGDFKFDQTPIDRNPSDLARLAEYGEQGVMALFSDSTNSESPGLAPSEFGMYESLGTLFRKAERKIIIASFASSIHRMQVIIDLARQMNRKVAPLGRSMISNIRVAVDLGYLHNTEGVLISAGETKGVASQDLILLASGSQGEPMAALSRLAVDGFKGIHVEEGDLVILSARIIPGNEKLISNMTNHFYRRGARVFDSRHWPVHASGHGLRDDLKLMINLTRPKFFTPIHGEYRQLKNHASLAADQGIPADNIHIIESGDTLRLSADRVIRGEPVKTGRRFIEERGAEEVHEVVLRDRRFLSEDGFLVLALRIDRITGELIGSPELLSRGFVLMEDSAELMEAVQAEVIRILGDTPVEEKQDEELLKQILRTNLKRFLKKQTGKRPLILPLTIEI